MLIDGKKLAEEVRAEIKADVLGSGKKIRLAVVQVGNNAVTEKFLEQKKKFGSAIGIDVRAYVLPEDISTSRLREKLAEIVHIKENTGVIVQLPLPKQIKTQYILDGIIPAKDPDMLSSKSIGLFSSGRSKFVPPVVGAIDYIFKTYSIDPQGSRAVVLGSGRLVGRPVSTWLIGKGAAVTVIDENTADPTLHTLDADILISGIGMPHLITKDMVKEGVIAIDCGTAIDNGHQNISRPVLLGDINAEVAEKALLFSPVPGGIGPLTVAILFKNLVELSKK